MAAAPGELLALANQGLVDWAGEQGDARAGNLVAEVPAGDAHLGGAGRPQHGVIEIAPLLWLARSSHQLNAGIYVLARRVVAVNRPWARPGGPCLCGKIVEYRGKSGAVAVDVCSFVMLSTYAHTSLALGPQPSQLVAMCSAKLANPGVLAAGKASYPALPTRQTANVFNHEAQLAGSCLGKCTAMRGVMPWRLAAAYELRNGMPAGVPPKSSGPDMIRAMSTELWLNSLAIRMDSRQVAEAKAVINLVTPDNGEKFVIELSNSALTNIKGYQAKQPDLTITLNRSDLEQVMSGSSNFERLIAAGKAKFEGDRKPFELLRAALVRFTPNFELLPGTMPAKPAAPVVKEPFAADQPADTTGG